MNLNADAVAQPPLTREPGASGEAPWVTGAQRRAEDPAQLDQPGASELASMRGEGVPRQVTPPARIDALTGLRTFPALAVLLSHFGPPPSAGAVLTTFLGAGYAGVTVFFVLSGFVLTHNYFDRFAEEPNAGRLRSYLVARLARVYPLYLLMLVWVSFPALSAGQTRGSLWVEHALGLQSWSPVLAHAYAFNAPGWSISVELFLYCCFPFLVLVLRHLTRTPRATLLAMLVVVGLMLALTSFFVVQGYDDLPWADPRSAHRWLYRSPLCRLGDFLLGMLTARLWRAYGSALRARSPLLVIAAASTIVGLMCWPRHDQSAASWDISYAVPAALLIFGLASAPQSLPARLLSSRPLLLLGEASFALYLCHVHVLSRFSPAGVPQAAWFLERALMAVLIIAVAVGLHVTLERPGRALLCRILGPRRAHRAMAGHAIARPQRQQWAPFAVSSGALVLLVPLLLAGVRFRSGTDSATAALTFEQDLAQALRLISSGKARESLAVLERAERLNADSFVLYNNRCIAHAQLGEVSAAARACRRALELDPGSQLARNNLAWVQTLGTTAGN